MKKSVSVAFFLTTLLVTCLCTNVMKAQNVSLTGNKNLVNENSKLCLALAGGAATRGAAAVLWDCDGAADKNWTIIDAGRNLYKIQSMHSKLFLGVAGNSTAAGATIVQWSDEGQASILWSFVDQGNGVYKIQNNNGKLFLAISHGSKGRGAGLIQWSDINQSDVLWKLNDLPLKPNPSPIRFTGNFDPARVEGKIFLIKNRANQLNLSVWEGNQSNVQMKKNTLEWEKWMFFHLGTDEVNNQHFYAIVNYGLGKVLQIDGTKPKGGGFTHVHDNWNANVDADDAVWYLKVNGDFYNIVSSYEGQANNLNGAKVNASDRVLTQSGNLGQLMDWELYEAGSISLPPTSNATQNMVIPTTPPVWNKDAAPQGGTASLAWQTVGSTILPFFMVNDNGNFASRLKSSPYYKIERSQRWNHIARQGNCGGASEVDKYTTTYERGLSEAKSKEFSLTVGFSVTAESGLLGSSVSATRSTELGWRWQTSTTTSTTTTKSREYNIPMQRVLHLWQVEERFTLYRMGNSSAIHSWTMPVEALERTEANCGAN
jgi:Ricin-type beta-trefoil lectin domain-like/Insecticidal Crystal Toxin, P42